jgi:hypothetical protein
MYILDKAISPAASAQDTAAQAWCLRPYNIDCLIVAGKFNYIGRRTNSINSLICHRESPIKVTAKQIL